MIQGNVFYVLMKRKPPILLIQSIHENLFLKIFCSLYVFLFLGVALPTHHHNDGLDHDDCIFCLVQKQAITPETVFSLPLVTRTVVELTQLPIQFYNPCLISAFQSRAPPVLKLS
jgi:hypothetical protein